MLKITKGLKPFIEDGISTYTDAKGNEYVRVKIDDMDFCIAAHDWDRGGKKEFTWDEAMELENEGMSMPTHEQIELYKAHMNEIDDKLKEIGGEMFERSTYWTSTDKGGRFALSYRCGIPTTYSHGFIYDIIYNFFTNKESKCRVRPVLNL